LSPGERSLRGPTICRRSFRSRTKKQAKTKTKIGPRGKMMGNRGEREKHKDEEGKREMTLRKKKPRRVRKEEVKETDHGRFKENKEDVSGGKLEGRVLH